jgi:hypothetical protein
MTIDLRSKTDPLFAADTPITPDPALGPKGSSKKNATREAMIARLVAAGMTPEEAARIVDGELGRSGARPQALFDQDNTPAGNAALADRVRGLRQKEGRQARFESDYTAATGMPEEAPAPRGGSRMGPVAQMDAGPSPLTTTEPGVRMPDGSRVSPPRAIYDQDEAAAYDTRTPNGPGWYNPSGRDKDMLARGYVPVMNDDGTVSYRLSPSGDVAGLPGAPGRGGRRDDLEAQMQKADGTPMVDAQGTPIPRFRIANMSGPLSENNSVYVQSNEAKAKQDAYMRERQLYRDAQTQGVSPAQLLAANPGDYGDLTAGGQRGRVNARVANEGASLADERKRMDAWRAQMTLGGGQPTAAQKAAIQSYRQLNDPSTNDWQKLVLAMRLGRDVQGITPIGAAAAHNAQLTKLGLEVAQGRGFQHMNPAQQAMIQQQMNAQKPVAERAQERVAAGTLNHPDVLEHANNIVNSHYSAAGALGNTSRFTDNEVFLAAQKLSDQTGMSLEDATKMMRGIQQERNNNATASTVFDWMYNQ